MPAVIGKDWKNAMIGFGMPNKGLTKLLLSTNSFRCESCLFRHQGHQFFDKLAETTLGIA